MNRIPFEAAIFDLDGTVLDSLYVWRQVDERFFGRRGIPVPEEYVREIAGMSFGETVAHTIRRFNLPDAPEAVMAEWMELARDEYAHRVQPVAGAREYLRALRRAGVKLAAATANKRSLFMPCLEHLGIDVLFDTVMTTGDIGDGNKSDGALFLCAAKALGARPERCAVFEDTLEGIRGARAAGMMAYAVRSAAGSHCVCEMDALADGVIDDFRGMRRYHEIPARRRCVIFTAWCEGDPKRAYAPKPGDCVLCADGGWHVAQAVGVKPDAVVGDFDSSDAPTDEPVERFPVEKDDTDTMLCMKKGLALGCDDFLIVGGFGGRLDHTLANLQALNYAASLGARAEMCDGLRWATVIRGGSVAVERRPGKLSVFALDSVCHGLCIRGAKYNVENVEITSAFPLGMGNDFVEDVVEISVSDGALLVMTCPE